MPTAQPGRSARDLVHFGTFLKNTPPIAVTAATIHDLLYTTGQHYFPYYMGVSVKNPGISTALGIVAATVVGGVLYFTARPKKLT